MNENIKKYIGIFLAVIVLFCTMYSCGKVVNAEVPSTQKVQKHTSIWTGYSFQYNGDGEYYTVEDATGIPDGTIVNPYYFVTKGDGVFYALPGVKTFATLLNKGIGLVVDPELVDTLFTGFFTAINITDGVEHKYIQKGLYDSNDNFLGYCLNDISDCYWIENTNNQEEIPFSSNEVNNVYNYYEYQNNTYPDFFTFYPFSNSSIYTNWHVNYTWSDTEKNYFNSQIENSDLCWQDRFNYYQRTHLFQQSTNDLTFYTVDGTAKYGVVSNNSIWNNFCSLYDLTYNELLATDMVDKLDSSNDLELAILLYDSSGNRLTNRKSINVRTQQISTGTFEGIILGESTNTYEMPFNKEFTVYKDSNVKTNLDNQTYKPSTYTTDSYINYDSNNDNSFTATIYQIDNSTSYNDSSYNNISENYYDYYDNGYVDTSSITNNTTTTINNYYETEPTPDNPDNPDNPDDNQTLDAILAAILRFFNAIGDIIGTVLAGLVNMISAVLESIAELTSDITNLSDVFASLLAWIPDPVPQVIGIGLSLVIIAGVIKFIRG